MTTPPVDLNIAMPTPRSELTAIGLFDAARAELIWPRDRRQIYCSVSGRPWCTVDDNYVRDVLLQFDTTLPGQLETLINRLTLFAGPSPLWQSKTPNILAQNKMIDPRGFLIYMLNHMYAPERTITRGDINNLVAWQKDMVQTYQALGALDIKALDGINDVLLILSGEGMLPPPALLKWKALSEYANESVLKEFLKFASKYFEHEKKRRHNPITLQTRRAPHPIHHRAFFRQMPIEMLDDKLRRNIIGMMLSAYSADVKNAMTEQELSDLKARTGASNPVWIELNRIAFAQGMTLDAHQRPAMPAKASATVEVTADKPFTIKFA